VTDQSSKVVRTGSEWVEYRIDDIARWHTRVWAGDLVLIVPTRRSERQEAGCVIKGKPGLCLGRPSTHPGLLEVYVTVCGKWDVYEFSPAVVKFISRPVRSEP